MKIGKTKLIPENMAPPNAKCLAIFDGDRKICDVDISRMRPTDLGEKLYSFGLVSDMHLDGVGQSGAYLSEAMTFFEEQGCAFCCHAGDMTNIGFWSQSSESIYLTQMADFKSVIDAHPNLPMHGICGNHESYNKSIMDNLAELQEYTGRDLYYTMTQGDDVFIFIGQPSGTPHAFGKYTEWVNELAWLRDTLEANRDKRCFVFEHLTLSDDSGNPNNIHNAYWGDLENTLVGIMKHYKNTMLFHGHSHLDPNEQMNWSHSNYSTKKGFRSVSVPSSAGNRITVEADSGRKFEEDANGRKINRTELRSGYVAEVYECHVVLRGYYFQSHEAIPIAQYCIDTTVQTVAAGKFTDGTGTITI